MAASISFQATDTDNGTIGGGASYTFPLTVGSASGQERLAIVGAIRGSTTTPGFSGVTIDGQTATQVGSTAVGGGGEPAILSAWRAAGTANTAINVVATTNGGADSFSGYCALWTLNDADTLLASVTTAVNDPTLSLNTATGGAVAAAVFGYSGSSPATAWTGLTENFDSVTVFGDDIFTGASAAIVTGETPRAISANLTPDLSGSIAGICVSFNGDAAAAATPSAGKLIGGILTRPKLIGGRLIG